MSTADRIDIRIHGRGGQGAVTLAALLVDAAADDGWQALGFPAFGTERTGAPVAAFVRLSRQPIRNRSEVRSPSLVLVQDPTLIGAVDVLQGMEPGGLVLLNATTVPGSLDETRVRTMEATRMAVDHLGVAKTSTAMLGFFAGATGVVSIEAVCRAIARRFTGEVSVKNEALARAAYAAAEGRDAA